MSLTAVLVVVASVLMAGSASIPISYHSYRWYASLARGRADRRPLCVVLVNRT